MVDIKTAAEIAKMREAGRLVVTILDDLSGMVETGVNLMDLEYRCREMIRVAGAASCYWDYDPDFGDGPFRNTVCLSLNDGALHGLPHSTVLADGDLLSIDLALSLDGWCGDSAVSVICGAPREEDERLIEATRDALDAGIAAAKAETGSATFLTRSVRSRKITAFDRTPSMADTTSDVTCTVTWLSRTWARRTVA